MDGGAKKSAEANSNVDLDGLVKLSRTLLSRCFFCCKPVTRGKARGLVHRHQNHLV